MAEEVGLQVERRSDLDELDHEPGARRASFVESFRLSDDKQKLIRTVRLRDGSELESMVPVGSQLTNLNDDLAAAYDSAWLRLGSWPRSPSSRDELRLVDLFSGCGGMTVGAAEAARALHLQIKPVLAVDLDDVALAIYEENFDDAETRNIGVDEIFDGDLGATATDTESELVQEFGDVDLLVGGPPCQGSSDLNNHTRRQDPKNALYARMARATEILEPNHVIVENVLGIRHDKDEVFQTTVDYLANDLGEEGYSVDTGIIRSEEFGVPQTRHRVFLVASQVWDVDLEKFLAPFRTNRRDFAWACADLTETTGNGSGFDTPSTPTAVTSRRIEYLFENAIHDLPDAMRPPCHRDKEHTYPAVYGRMWEDRPAPTITTGFTSMGQGRFVHPTERRTITPHEAARLQFIPDFFEFGQLTRSAYKSLIGNAVPPKLTYLLALQLLR